MSHLYKHDPTHTFTYGDTGEPQFSPRPITAFAPIHVPPHSLMRAFFPAHSLCSHHQCHIPKRESDFPHGVRPGHVLPKCVGRVPRLFHIFMSLQRFPSRGIKSENPWLISRLRSLLPAYTRAIHSTSLSLLIFIYKMKTLISISWGLHQA